MSTNQHIGMISEGSCDSEDWSNDAINVASHYRNKLHITISNRKQLFKINVLVYFFNKYIQIH